MTEFERIKAMSIDELAEYITSIMADAYHQCTKTMGFNYVVPENVRKTVTKENLKMLESEVETNGNL